MDNLQKNFEEIYDRYVDKIYRFIFFKVSSQEIAEDLCSETFLRAWKVFKNQNEIKNQSAFIYRIARNLVVDHYREKGRTQVVSADYVSLIDPEENSEQKSLLDSDLGTIRFALNKLKDNYQEVIICHYIDDLSVSETAKMLNKSEGAVRVMVHRALKALKKELDKQQKEV